MMNATNKISISHDTEGRTIFTVTGARSETFRTNRDGQGLFRLLPDGGYQQWSGTCQFAVAAGEPRSTTRRRFLARVADYLEIAP